MQVQDVMKKTPASVRPQATVWEAIQIILARKVSGLPVVDAAANSIIVVKARNGHVTLGETTLSEAQRDAARVLAENVNGVHTVTDNLVWADPMLQFGM